MLALPPRELAEDSEPVMFCSDFTDSWKWFRPNVIRFAGARFDEVPSRIREHVASPPWPAQHEATPSIQTEIKIFTISIIISV
jgi:hypothetical protein